MPPPKIKPKQDVDWKDDLTFATCSTDKAIHTCVVGEEYPRQTFTGQWLWMDHIMIPCFDVCVDEI